MDFLVVAAAAGAGYLVKHWQNFPGENDGLSVSSSVDSIHGQSESCNLLKHVQDRTGPFASLARKQLSRDDFLEKEDVSDGIFQEMDHYGDHSVVGVTSTGGSDGKDLANAGKYENYNVLSLSSLPPVFSGLENFQENMDGISGKKDFDKSDSMLKEFGTEENKQSLRRRRRSSSYFVKPLKCSESCLTAQLHREHAKMEYVYSLVPSPSTPMMRPLLVTDGSRIIPRVGNDSIEARFSGGKDKPKRENGVCLEENNTLLGAPSLQPIGSVELPRKPKQSRGKGPLSRFGTRVSGGPLHSQDFANGRLLFFIGITIGMMLIAVTNKREADKLNELLKQTENVVQKLHKELEMKDILTVKELANEGNQSNGTNNHSSYNQELISSSSKSELDESIKSGTKRPNGQKAENPELMRKIEAELEAELEMLELNMKASSLERIFDIVELDPGFEADVVQGNLKLDVARGQPGSLSDSENDTSSTDANHPRIENYAVSPWKLSLRLHEVIESRLEARIEELETALQNSQKKVHFVESQHIISQKGFAYSEVGSSSTPGSPTWKGEENDIDRSLAINFSGEALDAYNEAYEEIIRMIDGSR